MHMHRCSSHWTTHKAFWKDRVALAVKSGESSAWKQEQSCRAAYREWEEPSRDQSDGVH